MPHWSGQLINECVESLVTLTGTVQDISIAKELNQSLRDQWAEHGAVEMKQQRNLMTAVRRAIKDRFGEDHWSLKYIAFTKAEWTIINQPIEEQVATRNEQVQQLKHPDAIVAQAVRLLGSREWADIAAGLAVLTGRRSSEILATAQFEKKSQWSVTFTGALKRQGESQILSFEIPTLTTADQVIAALDKLRSIVDVQGMDVRQVNGCYSEAVAQACDL